MAEYLTVDQDVAGSTPVAHPEEPDQLVRLFSYIIFLYIYPKI